MLILYIYTECCNCQVQNINIIHVLMPLLTSTCFRYAKIHIPIIASVSEHQPTTWVAFFFDLHIMVPLFPAGAWICFRNLTTDRVFSECVVLCVVYHRRSIYRHLKTVSCSIKNRQEFVAVQARIYRDFYHLPRQSAIFPNFREKPRFLKQFTR